MRGPRHSPLDIIKVSNVAPPAQRQMPNPRRGAPLVRMSRLHTNVGPTWPRSAAAPRPAADGFLFDQVREADARRCRFPILISTCEFSTFGVHVFTPNQTRLMPKLLRVVPAPAAKIAASPTGRRSFIYRQPFKTPASKPAPAGRPRIAALWGTEARHQGMFGAFGASIRPERAQMFNFSLPSPDIPRRLQERTTVSEC